MEKTYEEKRRDNCCCLIGKNLEGKPLHCEHCKKKPTCECETCKERFKELFK